MTFAQITDTLEGGNGTLEFRLAIEGFDYSFVTSQDMANLSTYPYRINGLLREGLTVAQSVKLPDAKLEINTNNFSLVDYQEKVTEALYRKATWKGYLVSNVTTSDYVLIVSNPDQTIAGQYIWLNAECMFVLGYLDLGDGTAQLIVQRGKLGTTPQAHFVRVDMGYAIKPPIQNVPFTIERRRAYIYAYGKGEDLQGEGTLIWRGVVLTQPRFQGTKYTLEIGPITELLKCELGIDTPEAALRGINFGCFKWTIQVTVLQSNNIQEVTSTNIVGVSQVSVSGFYESLYEVARDFNSQLQAMTETDTIKAGCMIIEGNKIAFTQYRTTGDPRSIQYKITKNPITDAKTYPGESDLFVVEHYRIWQLENNSIKADSNTTTTTEGVQHVSLIAKDLTFPKQLTIYTRTAPIDQTKNYVASNAALGKRLYLNTDTSADYINYVSMTDNNNQTVASLELSTQVYADIVSSTTERYIETNLQSNYKGQNLNLIIIDNNLKINFGWTFGLSSTVLVPYNVVDFLRTLIEQSPDLSSTGILPLITANDIDLEDIQAEFNQISAQPFQTDRRYIFYKKTDSLENILNEEFKLLGAYPALTEDGKLTMRRLRNVNPYENPDFTLDSDDILTDNGYPTIETNKFGIWNSVKISTFWDAEADKFKGATIIYNNIESIAQYGRSKQVEIKPKSQAQYSPNQWVAYATALQDLMVRNTSLFSKDYWVVSLDVPIKFFNINIGSVVRIKSKQLPNYAPNFSFLTSRRGSARILGTVIGKKFDLGKGFGSLSILVSDQEFAGNDTGQKAIYSPDAMTNSSRINLGAGFWNVTLSTTYTFFLPDGTTQEDWWSVNDAVRFDLYSTTTHQTGYGKIVAITGTGNSLTLTIDFNGTGSQPASFGALSTYYTMKTANLNYIGIQDTQSIYAFNDSGVLGSDNTNYPGRLNRVFAF